jgi:protein PhnA
MTERLGESSWACPPASWAGHADTAPAASSDTAAPVPTASLCRPAAGDNPPMTPLPPCPQCQSAYTYEDGSMLICPECGHEWAAAAAEPSAEEARVIKDAVGNVLQDGDTVTVIKDLKIKGSSLVVKVGTKVKNIRLTDGDHDIDCKIDGIGAMGLKSEFVKKA